MSSKTQTCLDRWVEARPYVRHGAPTCDLPPEIWAHVFSFVERIRDVLRLRCVSRTFLALLKDPKQIQDRSLVHLRTAVAGSCAATSPESKAMFFTALSASGAFARASIPRALMPLFGVFVTDLSPHHYIPRANGYQVALEYAYNFVDDGLERESSLAAKRDMLKSVLPPVDDPWWLLRCTAYSFTRQAFDPVMLDHPWRYFGRHFIECAKMLDQHTVAALLEILDEMHLGNRYAYEAVMFDLVRALKMSIQ